MSWYDYSTTDTANVEGTLTLNGLDVWIHHISPSSYSGVAYDFTISKATTLNFYGYFYGYEGCPVNYHIYLFKDGSLFKTYDYQFDSLGTGITQSISETLESGSYTILLGSNSTYEFGVSKTSLELVEVLDITYNPPTHKKSLWCWGEEVLDETDTLLSMCQTLEVDCIYQEITSLFEDAKLVTYIDTIHNNNMDFYFIFGHPTYYNDLDTIKSKIDIVNTFNTNNPNSKVEGIIFDIEPYGESVDGQGTSYERSLIWRDTAREAYLYANGLGIRTIYCNPVWYSNEVITSFNQYSDGISYMNYVKPHLVDYIKEEMQEAIANNKWIEQITEFQDPIKAGINEEETFFFEGIHSAHKAWEKLEEAYPDCNLSFSYHYYSPLKNLLGTYVEDYIDSFLDTNGLTYLMTKVKRIQRKKAFMAETEPTESTECGDVWFVISK